MEQRATRELGLSRSQTVRLPEPVASTPQPTVKIQPVAEIDVPGARHATSGTYSLTPRKARAASASEATTEAAAECAILDILDGGLALRVNGQVCKLSWAQARALSGDLLHALK